MAAPPTPALGLDWRELLETFVGIHGSWVALADELERKMRLANTSPPEPATIEKGLRRLATRGNQPGGQYGRWVLSHLGVPARAHEQLRWLGQYHSRFSDLPTSLRLQHLEQWDRPPTSESRWIVWVHLGLASAHLRREEAERCTQRLAAAQGCAQTAGPMAKMELDLLRARVVMDDDSRVEAEACLDRVDALLDDGAPGHLPYRARLNAQRAFLLTRPPQGDAPRLDDATSLFESIPADSQLPFVDYRRTAGLAYCAWRSGDAPTGQRLAKLAAEHAADGGFIRFRVMALSLLAKMLDGDEAVSVRAKAQRLAASIEDFHLVNVAAPR